MIDKLTGDAFVCATPWCVVREQENQYLFYNTRSDEMHLVPPLGYFVYCLCDGARTVDDLRSEIERLFPECRTETDSHLSTFLAKLIERGILEVEHGDDE